MGFFGRSVSRTPESPSQPSAPGPESREVDTFYNDDAVARPGLLDEKLKLHERIIDEFNLALLEKLPPEELLKQVRAYIANYVRTEKISLNQKELETFSDEILDEMTGFGPIEPLLKDPTVTDILINTHKHCFVERFGKLAARPMSISRTRRTCCASSTRSSPASAAASTNPRRWSTRACRTARASMSPSGRSRSTARWCRSASSPSSRSTSSAWSSWRAAAGRWPTC